MTSVALNSTECRGSPEGQLFPTSLSATPQLTFRGAAFLIPLLQSQGHVPAYPLPQSIPAGPWTTVATIAANLMATYVLEGLGDIAANWALTYEKEAASFDFTELLPIRGGTRVDAFGADFVRLTAREPSVQSLPTHLSYALADRKIVTLTAALGGREAVAKACASAGEAAGSTRAMLEAFNTLKGLNDKHPLSQISSTFAAKEPDALERVIYAIKEQINSLASLLGIDISGVETATGTAASSTPQPASGVTFAGAVEKVVDQTQAASQVTLAPAIVNTLGPAACAREIFEIGTTSAQEVVDRMIANQPLPTAISDLVAGFEDETLSESLKAAWDAVQGALVSSDAVTEVRANYLKGLIIQQSQVTAQYHMASLFADAEKATHQASRAQLHHIYATYPKFREAVALGKNGKPLHPKDLAALQKQSAQLQELDDLLQAKTSRHPIAPTSAFKPLTTRLTQGSWTEVGLAVIESIGHLWKGWNFWGGQVEFNKELHAQCRIREAKKGVGN